jgi:hypothetical protein
MLAQTDLGVPGKRLSLSKVHASNVRRGRLNVPVSVLFVDSAAIVTWNVRGTLAMA